MGHEHMLHSGGNIFIVFLNETFQLWLAVSPYLLLGMLIAGILHIFLGKDFIIRHLGKGGLWSILKATLMGVPLPVCSCGVIPLASSLEKDGAHKSSVLAFMVSTPTTGIDSIMATYSLMGPLFAVFRPMASFVEGIVLGGLHYLSGGYKEVARVMPPHQHKMSPIHRRFADVIKYSFYEMPRDLGEWLIVGTVLGGFITAVIPAGLFSKYLFFPLDFFVALAVGIPMYVCATGSIPIAVSLIHKGFSPGAALVFLIAGPATNAITLSFVLAKLGRRAFYLYLGSIIGVSILMGLIFNFIWSLFGQNAALLTGGGEMLPFSLRLVSAVFLLGTIVFSFVASRCTNKITAADLEIKVTDMHCEHCRLTLEKNIGGLDNVDSVAVDLKEKSVKIKGLVDRETVLSKIKESGYTPEK